MSRAMRDSGIPWIGEIPQGWKVESIGSLYYLCNEKCSDKDFEPLSVSQKGVVPQLENVAKTDDGDNRKLVRVGDFCINSRSDRRGACGVSNYEGSVSLINIILRPRLKNMNSNFYNWLFHTTMFADEFYKYGHGIVDDLWTTRWQEMKRIFVIAPPLSEQKAIANFLDGKCVEIDEAVAVQEQMIDELRAYKQSVITEAVTHGLNPDAPMRDSGIPWIGQIPQAWDMVRFKTESKFINGYAFESDEFRLYNGVSVIRIGDIQSNIEYEKCAKVDSRQYLEDYKVCDKDILIAMSGATTGKCCLVETAEYAYINQRVGIIRGQNYKYLYYSLLSAGFAEYISLFNAGSAQPNISSKAIGNFILCKPENDECCKIVNYLDKKCTEIDELIAIKQQKIEALKEYKKSIIYEYVTGKKDVM